MQRKLSIAEPGQYLTFILDGQLYGVPIHSVREINRVSAITSVPQVPVWVEGVMNLRGKIIPVIDLRMKFGNSKTEQTKETCIIVIDGQTGLVGAIVDAVREVIELTQKQIEPPPNLGAKNESSHLIGLGKLEQTVYVLIDVSTALTDECIPAELKQKAV